ncbi:MAG: transposase [Phycisphaerales bacterium]|nr:transposase [Phycisphaerales bacterium]
MSAPAYFLTWSCYGTWLHGDARGSVDSGSNQRGTPPLSPDSRRRQSESERMRYPHVLRSAEARILIAKTIEAHCQVRKWTLLAVNVRSSHVHVVVDCHESAPPERAMEQFKSWSTRCLREAGYALPDQKSWTEHGSTR